MSKYLVFPIPIGLIEVTASNVEVARNKYRKAMPEMSDEEIIIVPSAYAQKTFNNNIIPLWKCNTEKLK